MDCERCEARQDPQKYFPLALLMARTNEPILKRVTCEACGAPSPTIHEFIMEQKLRNHFLHVGRGHPGHPTRREMTEICEWMDLWGARPDNVWLSYAYPPSLGEWIK